jgi:HAD superfamily hydrolase (TIGR01509 family)
MLKAVLFDFDGTLVDSESVWIEAQDVVLQRRGHRLDDAQARALVGVDRPAIVQSLIKWFDLPDHLLALEEELEREVNLRLSHARPMPGAAELLEHLARQRIPCAIVSNSPRPMVEPLVCAHGWQPFFTHILSVELVRNPKPHPELYMLVLERLALEPDEAIVFEDSPAGVIAARAAGLRVLAVQPDAELRQKLLQLTPEVYPSLLEARTTIKHLIGA